MSKLSGLIFAFVIILLSHQATADFAIYNSSINPKYNSSINPKYSSAIRGGYLFDLSGDAVRFLVRVNANFLLRSIAINR
jgi:hypothetical protein